MKSVARISRRALGTLALSAVALCAAVVVRLCNPSRPVNTDSALDALRLDQQSLAGFSDEARRGAEKQAVQLRAQLWNEARFSEWRSGVSAKWMVQDAKAEPKELILAKRVVVTRSSAGARDWPEIYEWLQSVDSLPAVVVTGLTLSMPDPRKRQFQTIQVILTFSFAKDESERGGV